MLEGQESALIVELPDTEYAIGDFRRDHDPVALRGIPAHVTLIYPFRDPDSLTQDVLLKVERTIERHEPFQIRFNSIENFPNAVWLAPEPAINFQRLTQSLVNVFPDCPPYGGKHPEYIPHMTLAQSDETMDVESLSAECKQAIDRRLPISARARAVSLFVSQPEGAWKRVRVFSFGRGTGSP